MSTVEDRSKELVVNTAREHGDLVRLSVKDSGVGLELLALDRLFQPFYTTKRDGMGMGLSICRAIVEAHEGRLSVSQNLPRGAIFQFTLHGTPTASAGP